MKRRKKVQKKSTRSSKTSSSSIEYSVKTKRKGKSYEFAVVENKERTIKVFKFRDKAKEFAEFHNKQGYRFIALNKKTEAAKDVRNRTVFIRDLGFASKEATITDTGREYLKDDTSWSKWEITKLSKLFAIQFLKWRGDEEDNFKVSVKEIDGHNMDEVVEGLDFLKNTNDNPAILIAHTVKGKGVSFMEDNPSFHGAAPNDEQFAIAMAELGEVVN